MKTYDQFITEAMESASSVRVQVSCTEDEFNESIRNINWLSGKLVGDVARFFGPQSDIDRWMTKNKSFLK